MLTSFSNRHGVESFVAMEAPVCADFGLSAGELLRRYDAVLAENGLTGDTSIMCRFHVSDIRTQAPRLAECLGEHHAGALVSVVQQPPTSGSQIALEAYHLSANGSVAAKEATGQGLLVSHGAYKSLWGTVLPGREGTAYEQTTGLFDTLAGVLRNHDATVRDHVMRTWLYVHDIDNNYKSMSDARREWFAGQGLTKKTHYIASTGIEGAARSSRDTVHMDYLAVMGLARGQVEYMSAPTHLNPTHEYGVTFERATRIAYGDRSHYYMSGTASIDNRGRVVHPGDVIRQTQRTMENINALLEGYGAGIEDMKLAIVYLRDSADHAAVEQYLAEHMPPSVAYIIVEAAVCRPSWLVEIDGIAVTSAGNDRFPAFC